MVNRTTLPRKAANRTAESIGARIFPERAISRSNESLMNTLTAATSYPCHGASQLSSFEIKWYLHIILSAQWKEKQNLKSGEWKLRRREWSSGSRSQYGRIGAENGRAFSHSSFTNSVENATLKSFERFKLKRKKKVRTSDPGTRWWYQRVLKVANSWEVWPPTHHTTRDHTRVKYCEK